MAEDTSWWDDLRKTVGTVSDVVLDGAKAFDAIANGVNPDAPPTKTPAVASTFNPVTSNPSTTPSAGSSTALYVAGGLLLAWLLLG
jgi:hypothetical protein